MSVTDWYIQIECKYRGHVKMTSYRYLLDLDAYRYLSDLDECKKGVVLIRLSVYTEKNHNLLLSLYTWTWNNLSRMPLMMRVVGNCLSEVLDITRSNPDRKNRGSPPSSSKKARIIPSKCFGNGVDISSSCKQQQLYCHMHSLDIN